MPAACKLWEVPSSSGFWMLAPYMISRCWWGDHRWMAISKQDFLDVVFHGELAGAGFVVPSKINACVFLPVSVGSDRGVFLKCGEDMLCAMFADIFDAKIIDT